jgi:hypothetical protein
MGFLDELLTGKGPSLQTRSLTTLDPTQRESLNTLLARLQQPDKPPSSYVAPLTAPERTSLTALEERSKALALPDANIGAAGKSLRSQLDFAGQTGDASSYFTNAVQNPMLEAFQRDILPKIGRSFGGADFFSTERQQTEGLARQDLLNALTGEKSRVELDQFNKSRERALTAAGLVPGITQAESGRTAEQEGILQALGLPRGIAQAGLDKSNAERARIEELLGKLATSETIENIGMTSPGSPGIINTVLGGVAGGVGGKLGDILGGRFDSWLENLLGGGAKGPSGGGASADEVPSPDNTGTTVTDSIPGVHTGAGAVGGALGGAAAGGAGAAVPGGAVTISDVAGNVIPSVASGGGGALPGAAAGAGGAIGGAGGLGALVAGAQPGIASGIAGTTAAGAAELGALTAPTIGAGGAATGIGSGAAGAGALSGAGALATGLGIAAIPIAGMLGAFSNNEREMKKKLEFQRAGFSGGIANGQQIVRLPDGSVYDGKYADDIYKKWKKGDGEFWNWIKTIPVLEGFKDARYVGRQLPGKRGGARQPE